MEAGLSWQKLVEAEKAAGCCFAGLPTLLLLSKTHHNCAHTAQGTSATSTLCWKDPVVGPRQVNGPSDIPDAQ